MFKKILTIVLILSSLNSFAATQCTIKGEVLNRDSRVLLFRKCSESFRSFLNNPVKIPIRKGKFDFTFLFEEAEAYQLIFEDELEKGNWTAITFFPANGIVAFELHPQPEWNKNKIIGGDLNEAYSVYLSKNRSVFDRRRNELMDIQKILLEKDEYDSPEYKEALRQLRSTKADDHETKVPIFQRMDELQKTYARYTDRAKQIFVEPYDSLGNAELRWKYDYVRENISIASYYLVRSDVETAMKNNVLITRLVTDVFPLYAKKFPEHGYTKMIAEQLAGLRTIKEGYKFIDVKAPSVAGDTVQLSTVVANRVALIDLWGSWCGPCIAKSRLVVPIYNQYKDKGFMIVGIAREFKSTDAVKKRLSKEQFSWLNLVDLDDKLNIWNQYGISNGTGLMVLVDKDGTILKVDPKPDELEKILQEKLR